MMQLTSEFISLLPAIVGVLITLVTNYITFRIAVSEMKQQIGYITNTIKEHKDEFHNHLSDKHSKDSLIQEDVLLSKHRIETLEKVVEGNTKAINELSKVFSKFETLLETLNKKMNV